MSANSEPALRQRLLPLLGSCCASISCPSGKTAEEVELASRSKQIDRQIKSDQRKMQQEVKLLLLGAGEPCKSTFLKQMKIIHGVVFEPEHLKEFRKIIYQNMIKGMRVLVDAQRKLDIELGNPANRQAGDQILLFDNFAAVDSENFSDFRTLLSGLWADQGIREAFERRAEYHLPDSMGYFYDHIDRISLPTYVPTQQDILYCRKTTKGINEFRMFISNVPFLFVDVGGQRTQRQKWFQCFDKVTAILFLASSSEFDQKLFEDKRVNRLEESRNIFDTIVNHRTFAQVSVILFLNKMDLLEDKVTRKKVDISQYFPEFDQLETVRSYVNNKFGGDPLNVADVKNFILYLFSVKQKFIHSQRPIYHHFTTAVNTKNIQYVFTSVKETILRKNLSALMLQ